jgi:hypothetical protein
VEDEAVRIMIFPGRVVGADTTRLDAHPETYRKEGQWLVLD